MCENLSNQKTTFLEKTGLVLDAYFSGTKIKWILDNVDNARKLANLGKLAFGTIDSWLIWKLTKGKVHATDVTNASRTLLFNINTLQWDNELLNILNIPKELLPKVVSSSETVGYTDLSLFGKNIPISGIAGDQQSALFGQMCIKEGDVKNTYGTGCFCIMNTGKKIIKSKNKMLSTIAWKLDNEVTYALEGSVFIAGAIVQWLRDKLNIIKNASEIENLAKQVDDNGGITFIPALSGLGAPYWNPNATGTIFGLTRDSNKYHIARAALEAIALRSREIILEMQKDAGFEFKELKVDGGASKNDLLMQIQANLLNKDVVRSKSSESTALGAAFFAGLSVGFWNSVEEIKNLWEKDITYHPKSNTKKTQIIIDEWNKRIRMVNG
jgi:glycerol kinase